MISNRGVIISGAVIIYALFAMSFYPYERNKPSMSNVKDINEIIDPNFVSSAPLGFVVQLVGASIVSPLNDPGYGIEAYLGKYLEESPEATTRKTYRSISSTDGKFYPGGRGRSEKNVLNELTRSFSFLVTYYWRDIEGFNMFMWKGVRMDGLPVVSGFTAERTELEAREIWDDAYGAYGLESHPILTVASGNSGWTTFDTAWAKLDSPASKVIWEVTVDLPSYPQEDAPNEAATLLMVAHPGYDTGRTPLVYFTAPAVVPIDAEVVKQQAQKGEKARVTALRLAVEQLCALTGIAPTAIGSLVTDSGRDNPAAAARLAQVSQALHDLAPQLDVIEERIDMPAVLGELGETTVNHSLILGAYAAHTRNHPVLYLSNVDSKAARAMLMVPPPGHVPPDPDRTFREHNPVGQWWAPWWGQRLDGRLDY